MDTNRWCSKKIHYSQQDITKKSGAHSQTIDLMKFTEFLEQIDFDVDIMLEVKDKNISAIKCIQLMTNKGIKKTSKRQYNKVDICFLGGFFYVEKYKKIYILNNFYTCVRHFVSLHL